MNIDPELKMCPGSKIEKHVLREAFDDKEDPYLPESVLWRQKEQGGNLMHEDLKKAMVAQVSPKT